MNNLPINIQYVFLSDINLSFNILKYLKMLGIIQFKIWSLIDFLKKKYN